MSKFLENKNIFKIPRREWPQLKDLYQRNWPKHILSFYTLQTYIKWVTENNSHDMTIYTTDEHWPTHGTYVLVEVSGPRCNVLFNTLDPSKTSHLLLDALKQLPKDSEYTLAAFVEQVRPTVESFLSHLGLNNFQSCNCDTILYYLPLEECLKLVSEPKPVYHLRPLSLDNVPLIDRLWPHRYPGSDVFIGNVIRHNKTLGAYEKKNDELCGWVMQEQVGTIGLLQVEDNYKRHGLGQQLVIEMARLMANDGMDATATVLCTNRPSRNLFQKLGFKIIDRVYWYDKQLPKQTQEAEKSRHSNISELLKEIDTV